MRGSVASACLCRRPGLNAFRIHLVTLRYNWKRKTVIVFLHKLSKWVNRHRKKPDDAPEALSLGDDSRILDQRNDAQALRLHSDVRRNQGRHAGAQAEGWPACDVGVRVSA